MILEVLADIWKVTNLPCAKRLKAILPLWLPFYDKYIIPDDITEKLQKISPATIDRLMSSDRAKCNKIGFATTKPGAIIKKRIPIKTNDWDERILGFLEADTVAHCGNSMAGMFVFTLNCVDIATGWLLTRRVNCYQLAFVREQCSPMGCMPNRNHLMPRQSEVLATSHQH